MKIETEQEARLGMALIEAATNLGNLSDDLATKTTCYRAASVACEAINDFLKGKQNGVSVKNEG